MQVKQKIILRKTKRGNISKIVREHYLRSDIHCGLSSCIQCADSCVVPSGVRLLDTDRVVIFDTSMALHQMDIVSHKAINNVIVLRTVLDVVREKSLAIYNRMREIGSDLEKKFYVFSNEYHKALYSDRYNGESVDDRNNRIILSTVEWYANHNSALDITFVTCSTEVQNQFYTKLSSNENVRVLSVEQFVEQQRDTAPELIDMIAVDGQDSQSGKQVFEEYYPNSLIQSKLLQGKIFQGKVQISLHNIFDGYIHTKINSKDITVKIMGKVNLNRAIQDDVVVVELLPKFQWRQADQEIIDEEGEIGEQASLVDGMILDQTDEIKLEEGDVPLGKVVGIIKRNWRTYAGVVDSSKNNEELGQQTRSVWFYPQDKRVPKIRIRTRQLDRLRGKRILVTIDAWNINDNFPSGHYVRDLGQIGDKESELEALLHEHDVRYQVFSPKILSELPPDGPNFQIPLEEFEQRQDFRHLNICSIDPPGCTDIDDALHCRKLEEGVWECGVHIADVTYFVKPNTAMDEEASIRGTTVYLVNQRIDMLPPLLGSNLCSLRSNVDRLAFSVIWTMNEDGQILSTQYTKSIIRSKQSFTYEEAQRRIDDKSLTDDLTQQVRQLNRFAKIFKQQRKLAGSLTLSSPEVRFKLENDSQDPVDVEMKELKETNALVEEFMLLANISVARQIWKFFPEFAILRRHPQPPQSNFEELKKFLKNYQLELHTDSSKDLSDSLDKANVSSDSYFNTLVRILTTRCMMQAVYFCSGTLSDKDYWHYGLATEIYTHFTSPIRRYADILVHRLLAASLNLESVENTHVLFDRVKMAELCDNLNYRHRQAQQAGRSSVELFTHLFFKDKLVTEDGYITRVMKNGASVIVPKYGIEGFVYSQNKDKSVVYGYDQENCQLITPFGSVGVLDRVKVKIWIDDSSVAGLRQRLRMELTN